MPYTHERRQRIGIRVSNASYKQLRNAELKKIIERESRFRARTEFIKSSCEEEMLRIGLRGAEEMETGLREGRHPQGLDSIAECERWCEKIDIMTGNIKYSLHKEKFFRYVHNDNLDKAVKYHSKCEKHERDIMDKMSENPHSYNTAVFEGSDFTELGADENGYIKTCDEMKSAFEFRRDLIARI